MNSIKWWSMFTHTKGRDISIKTKELLFIEEHIRELDSKTHEIMEKLKK